MVAPLARDIVVYCNGDADVTEAIKAAAKGRRVIIEPRRIVSLKRKDPNHSEIIVRFEDGGTGTETFMVSEIWPLASVRRNLTSCSTGRRASYEAERTFRRATWARG